MSEILQLDYYYGIEAEQFSFYRVPRLLIKDERFKKLSSDAKLLYGLMLDRMSLSIKNEWFDEDNRAYIIYTIDSIMEDLQVYVKDFGENKGDLCLVAQVADEKSLDMLRS